MTRKACYHHALLGVLLVCVTMLFEEAQSLIVNNHNNLPCYDGRPKSTTTDSSKNISTSSSGQQHLGNDGKRKENVLLLSSNDNSNEVVRATGTTTTNRGMRVALFLTYFAVMGAKCALPSTFSLLTADDTSLIYPTTTTTTLLTHSQQMSRMLTLSTVAIAVGKLVLGFAIDRCGGVVSLQVALCTLSVLMARIATATKFNVFASSWIFVDFIFSACWPASIKAIHEFFPPNEWVSSIGMLATAARIGNAVAFSSFALLLQATPSWRLVFGACSIVPLIPIILLTCFGSKKAQSTPIIHNNNNVTSSTSTNVQVPDHRQRPPAILGVIQKQFTSVHFWLHLTSRSCLMVFVSFLLFVPTYMIHAFGMTSSAAAQVGSIFAIGCLISVTVGAKPYSSYTTTQRTALLSSLLGCATLISFAQWAHVSGMIAPLSPMVGTSCMFLWGLTASLPFYIPPSLYALEYGGAVSSATIADLFDVTGFLLLARFNGYVASISHSTLSAWKGTFVFTTICSTISLCSLALATSMDGQRASREN